MTSLPAGLTEAEVERAARALCECADCNPDSPVGPFTDDLLWTMWKDDALAALTAAIGDHVVGWQPADTAPKDGDPFYATAWVNSNEDSLFWALFWNGEGFEATNDGRQIVPYFTHWSRPAPPSPVGEKP